MSRGVFISFPVRHRKGLVLQQAGASRPRWASLTMAAPYALTGWRCARRLVSPADGYQKAFRPALRRALLAWRCASVLLADPHASMEAIVPRVRCHAACHAVCSRHPVSKTKATPYSCPHVQRLHLCQS